MLPTAIHGGERLVFLCFIFRTISFVLTNYADRGIYNRIYHLICGGKKVIVYGDLLFGENFIIGCVLLYITGEIFNISFKTVVSVLRLISGGIMCGAFSFMVFVHVPMAVAASAECIFSAAVCIVVFGRKKLWQRSIVFILVTYFMGGLTMGLLFVTKNQGIYTASGIYTGDMKAGFLAAFIAIGLITAKQVIKVVNSIKFFEEHVFDTFICIGGESFHTRGYVDTGNRLCDPFSGRPAAVAQASLWQRLCDAGVVTEERTGVIPYEAVGGKGLLLSVRTDYIEINGRLIKDAVIAKGVEELQLGDHRTEGCELLLSKYMSDRKA